MAPLLFSYFLNLSPGDAFHSRNGFAWIVAPLSIGWYAELGVMTSNLKAEKKLPSDALLRSLQKAYWICSDEAAAGVP